MRRKAWFAAIVVAAVLLTGCATTVAETRTNPDPDSSHTMPDGTEMSGSVHEGHDADHPRQYGPSEAAQMICAGQVVTAVGSILGLKSEVSPSSSWEEPIFTCTFEIEGKPLVLSVHDATDIAEGQEHFQALQDSFGNAQKIAGMAGLGMPSFTTGDGIVAFVRDGKTLLVDATALPSGLGHNGEKTQSEAAYAVASAVLVCWVEHN
jgi:hypothetical protein